MSTTTQSTVLEGQVLPTWTVTAFHVNANGWSNVTEATTAEYVGRSEFYTGLEAGSQVDVTRTTYFRPDGSVVSEHYYASRKGGASLAIHEPTHSLIF